MAEGNQQKNETHSASLLSVVGSEYQDATEEMQIKPKALCLPVAIEEMQITTKTLCLPLSVDDFKPKLCGFDGDSPPFDPSLPSPEPLVTPDACPFSVFENERCVRFSDFDEMWLLPEDASCASVAPQCAEDAYTAEVAAAAATPAAAADKNAGFFGDDVPLSDSTSPDKRPPACDAEEAEGSQTPPHLNSRFFSHRETGNNKFSLSPLASDSLSPARLLLTAPQAFSSNAGAKDPLNCSSKSPRIAAVAGLAAAAALAAAERKSC